MKRFPGFFLLLFIWHMELLDARDARLNSWYTNNSGKYARIFSTTSDESVGNAVTTWSRGQGTQSQPTYTGVHEVSYSGEWVYIRTTGLGTHTMGPWYLNAAKTNLFPNYPSNQAVIYRMPRNPTVPLSKTLTGLGAIGYFVDGVAMFDSRDAFSYSNSNGRDASPNSGWRGDGIWNRDAWVNEGVTFDAANAHQAGSNYHYHANPPALRYLLGDHVDYDAQTNTYTENPAELDHSPILGWVKDGFPLYGPYGFSDPQDSNSTIRLMVSGFQKRDGTNGTTNLASTGRISLPAWAVSVQNNPSSLASSQYGPAVSGSNILGHYIEDYDYKGDLGLTQGIDFDLDLHNGRFCITPDFPEGTYAYFVSIEPNGTPAYPYNIGRTFYGNPVGGTIAAITEDVGKFFEGGPEVVDYPKSLSVDSATGDVTLIWNGLEGGAYEIETSPDLKTWTTQPGTINANTDEPVAVDVGLAKSRDSQFYRIKRLSFSSFDDRGFDYEKDDEGDNSMVSIIVTVSAEMPAPPVDVVPISTFFNGSPATFVSRPAQDQVQLQVNLDGLADGEYEVSITFSGPAGTHAGTYTLTGNGDGGPTLGGNNLLLLILDDWGVDASPLDNTIPGAVLPKMPTLQSLATSGVRFTNAYAQPLCSPTRATIITGRLPFRNGVGNPTNNSVLAAEELAVPEIFTAQQSNYALASFGKWHLGGNTTGSSTLGGWNYFKGIQAGGVTDYNNWTKLEVINGVATKKEDYTTYTTTDQVNDAISWISSLGETPWLCWMAFNAPHSPFHEPPAALAPEGGFSTGNGNAGKYIRTLEALDTEINRLLESLDLDKTNVILMGDNGTPSQVAQAPFSSDHAKGEIYQGGVHVPMVISGPDVAIDGGSVSRKLVNSVDLFSTILELCGMKISTATSEVDHIDSKSLVPILLGQSDNADRTIVVEKFGDESGNGRALISDEHPDYKLIIFGDPHSTEDTPLFHFFNITNDPNEESPLNIENLSTTQQIAYDHLIAKDVSIGGGYSDPPGGTGNPETIFIVLPSADTPVPPLVAAQGPQAGQALHPISVTIGGKVATFETGILADGNPASRVNSSNQSDRYGVKAFINPASVGLSSGTHTIQVSFPPHNAPRIFTASNSFTVP
ncbi:MAG: sulfatase-like hydrolase/transferase [Opitutae bacterium]|nr:sulfatase-like hydrolase/transferase [Opitutae bacterium]